MAGQEQHNMSTLSRDIEIYKKLIPRAPESKMHNFHKIRQKLSTFTYLNDLLNSSKQCIKGKTVHKAGTVCI